MAPALNRTFSEIKDTVLFPRALLPCSSQRVEIQILDFPLTSLSAFILPHLHLWKKIIIWSQPFRESVVRFPSARCSPDAALQTCPSTTRSPSALLSAPRVLLLITTSVSTCFTRRCCQTFPHLLPYRNIFKQLVFLFLNLPSFPLPCDNQFNWQGSKVCVPYIIMGTPANVSTVNNRFYTGDLWDDESQSGRWTGFTRSPLESKDGCSCCWTAPLLPLSYWLVTNIKCDHLKSYSFIQRVIKESVWAVILQYMLLMPNCYIQISFKKTNERCSNIRGEAGTHSCWTGSLGRTARHL